MAAGLFDHVQPLELARQALAAEIAKFVAQYRDTQFLVIHLPDANGALAAGLNATAGDERTAVQPAVQLLSYNTVLHSEGAIGTVPLNTGVDQAQKLFLRRLRRALQFVVPLRKRTAVQSAFRKRISVGRATNQDILLRDASVSKSHAWFEVDETGTFHVADAGSTNGTKIENDTLEPRSTTPVQPGQLITFGSVEALLVDAESLWRVFDSARSEWRPPSK